MCYIRTQWMISLLRTSSSQVIKNVNMCYIRTQWMISLLRTSSSQVTKKRQYVLYTHSVDD